MRWKSANWRPYFAMHDFSHDSMLTAVCDLVVVSSGIDTGVVGSSIGTVVGGRRQWNRVASARSSAVVGSGIGGRR